MQESVRNRTETPNTVVFIKRCALEFLQALFSQREDFTYNSEDSKTNILICDQHAENIDNISDKPGIIAVRGPVSILSPQGLGGNGIESRNMMSGAIRKLDVLAGSIVLNCVARNANDAENIAHIVFNSFNVFSEVLRKKGFFSVKGLNIGNEQVVMTDGGEVDMYIVPVYVNATMEVAWSLEEGAKRHLESIIIEKIGGTKE